MTISHDAAADPTQILSAVLPSVAEDGWDDATLAYLAEDAGDSAELVPAGDLRSEHYTEQVVAALHGDPAVLGLDADVQAAIARVGRTFDALTDGLTGLRDDKTVVRRAAVLLLADGLNGTPMRCPACDRVCLPLEFRLAKGPVQWNIAGREDIMCPACAAAQPKHSKADTKPVPPAAKTRARPRPSRARRNVTGGT